MLAIGLYVNRKKLLHGRNDDLLLVDIELRLTNHRGIEINVRDMLVLDRQFNELCRSGDMNQFVAIEIFAFHTEENVAIGGGD